MRFLYTLLYVLGALVLMRRETLLGARPRSDVAGFR
jgi:hypothetical protein